jgi:AraC-like DNA-binding protein
VAFNGDAGDKLRESPSEEKLIAIPLRILKDAREKTPVLFRMYITKIGYFPAGAVHYREEMQGSPDNILIYCVKGAGHCVIHNKRFEVLANEFIIIPATQKLVCYWPDHANPWTVYWLHFTGPDIAAYNKALNIALTNGPMPIAFNDAGISVWSKIYATLSGGFKMENLCTANFCLQYMISTFLYPGRHVSKSAESEQRAMDSAVKMMKSNINAKVSVHEIAEKVNFSYSHFCLLFKKTFGTSPIDYFIGMKIQKACKLLLNNNGKIKEVSLELGYDDQYYFSRIFKKVVGVSPGKFRNNHRNNQGAASSPA